MKKITILIAIIVSLSTLNAQNLIINPDAESLPRGTGWTIVSQGALTCLLAPSNDFLNWTMKPDGSVNYPYDHTTGAVGGTVFFSGCDTYLQGPFELFQVVDVTADAPNIDAGNQLYTFTGYIQTPVDNQTDQGRFIVDFLNASNVILGTSYTSNWQSFFNGSGAGWNLYSNTRLAPVGTRKVKIRLQSQIIFNQPAINVYFDDVSLTRPSVVAVKNISFNAKQTGAFLFLNWNATDEADLKHYELERSNHSNDFKAIGFFTSGKNNYQFIDKDISAGAQYYYRLKMISTVGKISYSNILSIKASGLLSISMFPNPAKTYVNIHGLSQKGMLSIVNASGKTMLVQPVNTTSATISLVTFPSGTYVLSFRNDQGIVHQKLLVE